MTGEKTQFHRKHFFIDRKFQSRYMLTYFIPMIIMLAFMVGTLYFAAQTIINTTTRILRQNVENAITLDFQDQQSPSVEKYAAAIGNVSNTIRTFSDDKTLKREMLVTLLWVFGIGLFLVIVQIVMMTIFFSHKVAGPIYRFECFCHDIIEGRYSGRIKLRNGDELVNLAGLLNAANDATRQRINDLLAADSDEKRREISSRLEL
ncbi:MAG: hypothetical protein MUF22_08690 [Chitinispirillaceae bacterium]|jgi:nitrate/nitrite-specific signal transduction histidine kinase|nr:hypothetical protein [Chitinispirillaceae bacterium]